MSTQPMRPLRATLLLALLGASLGAAAHPAAAQDSGLRGDDAWVSPLFGFEVDWGGPWEYVDGSEAESDDERDHIDLVHSDLAAVLHINAFVQVIDPVDEVADVVGDTQAALEEDGEAFELVGETATADYVAALMEYTVDGGRDYQYVESSSLEDRTGEEGTLSLQLMMAEGDAEEAFTDLVDRVTLAGDPVLLGDLAETMEGSQDRTDDPAGPGGDAVLDDEGYSDGENGWSVSFDEGDWEAEAIEETSFTGVTLTGEDGFVNLRVYDDGIDDAGDCLSDLDRFYTSASNDWEDLAPASRLDPPSTDRGAEAQLYAGTFVGGGDELDAVLYLECRELEGATLAVDAGSTEAAYEDFLPSLEDVLGGIEIGDPSDGDDETTDRDAGESRDPDDETAESDGTLENDPDAGELDGDTFTDPNLGYSISWDDDEWAAELIARPGLAGVVLSTADPDAPYLIQIIVDGTVGYEDADAERCLEDLADFTSRSEGYSDWVEAPRVDGPEPPPDGAATTHRYTFTDADGTEFAFVDYSECRPAVDGVMVRMSVNTTEEWLADNVAVVQEVLDAVDVAGAGDRGE